MKKLSSKLFLVLSVFASFLTILMFFENRNLNPNNDNSLSSVNLTIWEIIIFLLFSPIGILLIVFGIIKLWKHPDIIIRNYHLILIIIAAIIYFILLYFYNKGLLNQDHLLFRYVRIDNKLRRWFRYQEALKLNKM